ncbi:MAG: amidohydrolase family protein [Pseudomonadota bacterium]|nr:amidohydrolase family protein [Pseudomonadota bacterium]
MPEHDLILHNGPVITLDGGSRVADAVAVTGGLISAVGSSAELLADRGRTSRVIDLDGRTACPGFFDTHAHMDREGLKSRSGYSLAGRHSVAAIADAVASAVARTPKNEWVIFMPMGTPKLSYISRPDQLEEGRFPTRQDLDAVSPDNPVYIRVPWGWWVHRPFVCVANSAAMKLAGIDRHTEAPYNVEIVKDDSGEPTGVFLDRSYAPVIEYTLFRCAPRITFEDRVAGCRLGAAAYAAAGTTSIYEGHGLTPAILEAYRRVHEDGDLTVRVNLPLSVPGASVDDRRLAEVLNEWSSRLSGRGHGDDMYRIEGICVDVANDQAAAIIGEDYPYEALAGHFYHSLPHERFVEIGVRAARLGIRLNCLICYDLERVLRAYEAIDAQVPIRDRRWVMIHVIEATPDQIRRMKALGVIATVTPNFMYMASDRFNLQEIGDTAMPVRALIDAGVPVALSSDNVPYSMLWTMWEALARWDGDSGRRLGDSNLTREEALRMICQTGALVTWEEYRKGTLEVGKLGDVVILDGNPLTCEEDELKDIRVDHTFLGGREVFGPGMTDPGPVDGPDPG